MVAGYGLELELKQLRRLETASLIEATTLLLLVGIASPAKHFAGWPLGVAIMGPSHGIAFCFYLWTSVQTVAGGGWKKSECVRLIVTAFVPLGGYLNGSLIRSKANEFHAAAPAG